MITSSSVSLLNYNSRAGSTTWGRPEKENRMYVSALVGDILPFPQPHQQDYLRLASDYSVTAPYRDTAGNQTCVVCGVRKASGIFFPCEHKSVCGQCIELEGFGTLGGVGQGLCPICCEQISYVVPYKKGKEVDQYWEWIQQIKPPLPRGFRRDFHLTAILLKIKTEPDSHKTWDRPRTEGCCTVS